MSYTNLSYRCYYIPFLAAIYYYILSSRYVVKFFEFNVPDENYASISKSIILLILLFVSCRIIDINHSHFCHDKLCDDALLNYCINIANTISNDNNSNDNNSNDNNSNDNNIANTISNDNNSNDNNTVS
jgi:hypothetical protein